MTMTLTRWSPVRDLAALEIERLNRMFESAFTGEPLASGAWVPAADIYETAGQDVVVKIELAGCEARRHQGDVREQRPVDRRRAEVRGDVKRDQYHRVERGYGAFRRSFSLPASVDPNRVEAGYQDGVLTVTLPRREETRPKQIQVNG